MDEGFFLSNHLVSFLGLGFGLLVGLGLVIDVTDEHEVSGLPLESSGSIWIDGLRRLVGLSWFYLLIHQSLHRSSAAAQASGWRAMR